MNDDDEVLKAIGRAIEEQAKATRYVMAIGFIAVVVAILIAG